MSISKGQRHIVDWVKGLFITFPPYRGYEFLAWGIIYAITVFYFTGSLWIRLGFPIVATLVLIAYQWRKYYVKEYWVIWELKRANRYDLL